MFRIVRKDVYVMNKKIEEILSTTKLNELLKREEKKECNKKILWGILAAVGVIVVVAGIAYAVYYFFFARKALEDFEDEYIYDDDFDIIDDEDEDVPVVDITIEEPAEDAPVEEAPAEEAPTEA